MATPITRPKHVDVLIIGAGISGIGTACHLKTRRPGTSFMVLEGRDTIGGTWSLFRYPGIRSDSDMQTFGFGFKPWTHRKAIADGHLILDYLQRTVDEHGLQPHIRFGYQVLAADFNTADGLWTVTARHADSDAPVTFTSRFLFSGTGYYDYAQGFTPDFAGVDDFRGQVVHPQFWPEDLDYTGKRVVVIGSGATAVTLVPSMAARAGHVTMLQRSPGYVISMPSEDGLANSLNQMLGPERAQPFIRFKNILEHRLIFRACRFAPRLMRRLLIAHVRRQLPKGFDVDTHFHPRYNPWEERLCVVPDGDLFKAISAGQASVVTDRIERFTATGLRLESGQELEADIIVTATGLQLSPFGKIRLHVDRQPVHLPDTTVYKAMMLSGVPNFAFALGYTNISWTLKVDLVAEHFCRLLDFMDEKGHDIFEPRPADPAMERVPYMDLKAGYVQRGIASFPRAGAQDPWTNEHAFEKDVKRLRKAPVTDSALRFSAKAPAQPAVAGRAG